MLVMCSDDLGAGLDRHAIAGVEPRQQLGGALKLEIDEVVEVELFALFVDRALDIEADPRDLARRQMLEVRGHGVELDRPDRSHDAQTGIGPHASIVSGLRWQLKLDAIESARHEDHILVAFDGEEV